MNNLAPQLTLSQLQNNIDALQKGGMSKNDIQSYVNNYKSDGKGGFGLSAPQPTPPSTPNLVQRVADDTNAHAANITEDLSEKPSMTGALDVAGNVAGEVGDFFGEPLKSAASTLLPQALKDALSGGVKSIAGTPAAQGVITAWNNFQAQHPDAAKNIGNVVNIGALFGGEAASPSIEDATQAAKDGLAKAGDIAKDAITPDPEKAAQKELQSVIEVVRPKLTPTEEASAKAAGRGVTTGILRKTSILPSTSDIEMANAAKEAGVSGSKTFDENIQLMKTAQQQSAQLVRKGLQDSDAIWNPNELKGKLNQVQDPITVKSDVTLRNQSKYLKQGILKLLNNATKKPEGILDVRQGFDDLVEKEFGSKVFIKTDPIGQIIRSYRQKLNEFAESKLPDGKLPNGNTLRGELRRQSVLYDAIDNVASKAPKAGDSAHPIIAKSINFAKKHPVVSAAAVYGAEKAAKSAGVPLP